MAKCEKESCNERQIGDVYFEDGTSTSLCEKHISKLTQEDKVIQVVPYSFQ